jgi:hypothetical protein
MIDYAIIIIMMPLPLLMPPPYASHAIDIDAIIFAIIITLMILLHYATLYIIIIIDIIDYIRLY